MIRVVFNEAAWADDLRRASERGRDIALDARRRLEREGALALGPLRQTQPLADDGTRLPNCVKVYLPEPSDLTRSPYRIVPSLRRDPAGQPVLAFLAFGVGHPPPATNRPSVYHVADRRLWAGRHRPG